MEGTRRRCCSLFLAGIMIPGQMILLPLFTIYFRTGLTGTLWPLIITYTAIGLPLTVFMMATYFRGGAARDLRGGDARRRQHLSARSVSIGFPLVRNAIFTVALVQFFFIWNDLLIALTFTTSDDLRTIQVGCSTSPASSARSQYGPTFAAISINVHRHARASTSSSTSGS